jgi:hypothetical protein
MILALDLNFAGWECPLYVRLQNASKGENFETDIVSRRYNGLQAFVTKAWRKGCLLTIRLNEKIPLKQKGKIADIHSGAGLFCRLRYSPPARLALI